MARSFGRRDGERIDEDACGHDLVARSLDRRPRNSCSSCPPKVDDLPPSLVIIVSISRRATSSCVDGVAPESLSRRRHQGFGEGLRRLVTVDDHPRRDLCGVGRPLDGDSGDGAAGRMLAHPENPATSDRRSVALPLERDFGGRDQARGVGEKDQFESGGLLVTWRGEGGREGRQVCASASPQAWRRIRDPLWPDVQQRLIGARSLTRFLGSERVYRPA